MSFDIGRLGLGFCAGLVLLAGCGGRSDAPLNPPSSAVKAPQIHVHPAYGVIYDFKGPITGGGQEPYSKLAIVNGSLFGTTVLGGASNNGSTFGITTSRHEIAFYSFNGSENGGSPEAGLAVISGTLYGTTSSGGQYGKGTVFEISSGSSHLEALHSFGGTPPPSEPTAPPDGETSSAPLHYVTSNRMFYGTTQYGGKYNRGTIFDITPSGAETVLHSFAGGTGDGETPFSGLSNPERRGTLYGTTELGGEYHKGTVYAVSLSGQERVVYSFGRHAEDGEFPITGVIGSGGALYGTTYNGGTHGQGTVFKILVSSGNETVLHSFDGRDGSHPNDVLDINGTLYGTTGHGGSHGAGTVFKMSTSGRDHTPTTLHDFPSFSGDGKAPAKELIEFNGILYGTTRFGGTGNCRGPGGCGTVFSLPESP